MKLLRKIKYVFSQTRFPFIILAILFALSVGYTVNTLNQENTQANHVLRNRHTKHIVKLNANQHEIFKNRAQLSALSDEHNADLMQDMFNRMMKMQKEKHPKKLTSNPKYMHMTSEQMQIDDRDNGRISQLNRQNRHLRHQISFEHNHTTFTNVTHHGNAEVYNKMVQNAVAFVFLLIIDLSFVTYVFKFKDIQLNKWRRAVEDRKRKRYIAEYGDDEGFKTDNDESDADGDN